MKKKFLAILLAAIMVLTLLPTVAFAETTTPIEAITFSYPSLNSLIGKTVSEVKNTLFTNVQDGDGTELEIVRVFVQTMSSLTPLADTDTLQAGAYAMYAIIKAPSGSNFPYTVVTEPTTVALFSGTINDEDNPVVTGPVSIMAVAQKNGDATSSNIVMSDSMAENDEPATYLALGYNVTLEAPEAPSGSANVKGTITAADFGYELIIPADTTLTEDNHKDVLLGNDGKVSIEVTKHSADNVDVSYTVDLENGSLTDGGGTTIAATYKYKQGEAAFATIVDDGEANATKVTVYTGGSIVDSYVNVTADSEQWDAAPVGDYNATVVFNFEDETIIPTTVADIADGVIVNLPNEQGKYMRYTGGNLIIVAESGGTEALVSVPGTTVVTETTYDSGFDGTLKAWTCTVDGATYLFRTSLVDVVIAVDVSGLINTDYNGLYAAFE